MLRRSPAECFVFVDDGRIVSDCSKLTALATRRITSRIQWLGEQDASRKREPVSQRPRAYTGGVFHTDKGLLRKFLVPAKWKKIQTILSNFAGKAQIDRKEFESGLGFLVHSAATYHFMWPYLLGFYLALNRFREGRDADGWIIQEDQSKAEEELDHYFDEEVSLADETSELRSNPPVVEMTDLLSRNIGTLQRLTQGELPLQLLVRPVHGTERVAYAGSDASGEGFGGKIWFPDKDGQYVYGFWNRATENTSSNWREMKAVLDRIRIDSESGALTGREVWFFTDNSTLEKAFYKGYSSSPELYLMIEEMWSCALAGEFLLRIVHVAGTRMIDTGIDGLSRGEMEVGLIAKSLRDQVPLALSPCSRSRPLRSWLRSLLPEGSILRLATPFDWHYAAHQSTALTSDAETENWLWDLPPAAAHYALEELSIARTKRRTLLRGLVIIPNLMSPEWMRRVRKATDICIWLPAGAIAQWGTEQHEGLTLAFYFPTLRFHPWDWKCVTWMGRLGRKVSSLFKENPTRAWDLLRTLWKATDLARDLSPRVVRQLLSADSWEPLFRLESNRRSGI